eukprot:s2643_g5.t1
MGEEDAGDATRIAGRRQEAHCQLGSGVGASQGPLETISPPVAATVFRPETQDGVSGLELVAAAAAPGHGLMRPLLAAVQEQAEKQGLDALFCFPVPKTEKYWWDRGFKPEGKLWQRSLH